MWNCLKCVGVVTSCIIAMVVRQLLRHGDINDLCDAASMSGGIIGIFGVVIADAIGHGDPEPGTHSWAEELGSAAVGAACALTMFIAPRFVARFLVTRLIWRRYDALAEGDRIMMLNSETTLVWKYKRDGEMHCLFIVGSDSGYECLMFLGKDMFFRIMTDGHPIMFSLRIPRCPRGELVALVREKAADELQIPYFRWKLAVIAWQLERPVRVIQRAVRRSLSDPSFLMCRRRLQREWHQLCDCCQRLVFGHPVMSTDASSVCEPSHDSVPRKTRNVRACGDPL